MNLKKKLLKKSSLYVVIDKKACGRKPLPTILNKLIKAGSVDMVQLRDKQSKREVTLKEALAIKKLLKKSKTLFIVNDYLDIAKIADSDGLHIGSSDTPIETAREILGKDKIIGASCHSLSEAQDAQRRGADYISIGPLFRTKTKPGYKPVGLNILREIKKRINIPFFAIGDVNLKNLQTILSYGVRRVAVCRAILQASNLTNATKKISKILHS